MSVIERIWDRIVTYDSVSAGFAQLSFRAALRVLSIEGYRDAVAGSGGAQGIFRAIMSQIGLMRYYQSNEHVSVIDLKDKPEVHNQTFTGMSDLMIQFWAASFRCFEYPACALVRTVSGRHEFDGRQWLAQL